MQTGLEDIMARASNPAPFIRRVLELTCTQAVRVLQENSPSTNLLNEWRFEIEADATQGRARIFHERLEADRETWEIVFHAHNSGSRRYMIYPQQAQALSWVSGGQRFFSKGHEVGGIRARHFAERADRVIADMEQNLQGYWERWMSDGILP